MKSEVDKYLLTAALAPPIKANEAWEIWSNEVEPKDAPHVLSWAGGYIYLNLKNLGIENHYLRGIFRHNFLANNYRLSQVKGTLNALTDNWEISPIKSFGMTVGDNSLGLRPIADFDFYVKSSCATEVFEFLETQGYAANLDTNLFEFRTRLHKRRGSWNFVNSEGFDLDLHWRLFDHLSVKENESLLVSNAQITKTKHGKFRILTSELMCVLLANHQLLNTSEQYSGLFDIARIIGRSDVKTVSSLASKVGVLTEMREIFQLIDEFAESSYATKLIPIPSVISRRSKNNLINRSTDYERIRFRFIYKVWSKILKPVWMEKLVTKHLGGFTISKHAENDTFQGMHLGSGWHYQYPGDKHRWLNIGDSRFTFFHTSTGVHELILKSDPHLFSLLAHIDRLNVFANGELIGIVEKSDSLARFEYTVKKIGNIEFSIRSEGAPYSEIVRFDFNWRLLSFPLISIQSRSLIRN
jgi:hypothetical protein